MSCQRDEGQRMFDKGRSLWEAGKYDEAIQNLIVLTTAYPDHHLVDDSLFWVANIYEHYLHNPKQAIRFYRSLNSRFEDSEHHTQSMLGLARVRSLQGDEGKRKAIRIFRELQKQDEYELTNEEWEQNQFRLVQLFFELKNYEQARVELKRLIFEKPKSDYVPEAYYQIGRSYYIEGKNDLAKIAFLQAEKKYGFGKETLSSALNLADLYEETGRLKEAIQVYETILSRLEEKEVFYQLASDRIRILKSRLRKTKTG